MENILPAILPIVACLALGRLMTELSIFESVDWPSLERVMFWVFLPVLIFRSILNGQFVIGESLALAAVFFSAQAIMAAGAVLHARLAGVSPASMTSLFQNAVRWNNIIPIALVTTLYGDVGLSVVAVALAVMVPLANVSCIFMLEYALNKETSSFGKKFAAVLKNPLIVACILGVGVRLLGIEVPNAVLETLDILGSATLGVGLLAVGAGVEFSAMTRDVGNLAVASLSKMIMMPMITLGLCAIFGVSGIALLVAVICTSAPTAMQGYIVARSMGGDALLMGSAIAVEHVLAVVTIPIMFAIAESLT